MKECLSEHEEEAQWMACHSKRSRKAFPEDWGWEEGGLGGEGEKRPDLDSGRNGICKENLPDTLRVLEEHRCMKGNVKALGRVRWDKSEPESSSGPPVFANGELTWNKGPLDHVPWADFYHA